MPRQTIVPIVISERDKPTLYDDMYTDLTVPDEGGEIDVSNINHKRLLLIVNAEGDRVFVTVKKGTGPCAASEDMKFLVEGNTDAMVFLESGRYLQTEGEDRGKYVLHCHDQCKVSAILFD